MKISVNCVHCGTSNYKKKGFRRTKKRGKIQKYYCFECNKYFTNDYGFYRMRNQPNKITEAIDLYFSNLSSRKVRNHFKRHRPDNCSHVTVLDWCRRYVLKIQNYVDTLNPQLSGKFYADETEIPRGCNTKRKGGDKFWCSVDWDTRYINATLYSPNPQNMKDGIDFMKRIKKSKPLPKYIQTDALPQYPRAFKTVFYSNKGKREEQPEHIVNNVQDTNKHNVRIETVFMKVKDRVDDFRGLKALWSAPILMQGIILQHNFIEAHTTTGKVPCELAGLYFPLGQNRWLGLIKLSSKCK
tara:strand:- start:786 stop:1679 length:894 start_codon:yes stop_codon:yes gene_type:complete